MGMRAEYVDPYGAPEFLVEGVAYREMIGTDLVRSVFFASERGDRIIRVKLLIPVLACSVEHRQMQTFIAANSYRMTS